MRSCVRVCLYIYVEYTWLFSQSYITIRTSVLEEEEAALIPLSEVAVGMRLDSLVICPICPAMLTWHCKGGKLSECVNMKHPLFSL